MTLKSPQLRFLIIEIDSRKLFIALFIFAIGISGKSSGVICPYLSVMEH